MDNFMSFQDYLDSLSVSELVQNVSFNNSLINSIDEFCTDNNVSDKPFFNHMKANQANHKADYLQAVELVNEITSGNLKQEVISQINGDSELYGDSLEGYISVYSEVA